jgi:hypothetical protein
VKKCRWVYERDEERMRVTVLFHIAGGAIYTMYNRMKKKLNFYWLLRNLNFFWLIHEKGHCLMEKISILENGESDVYGWWRLILERMKLMMII